MRAGLEVISQHTSNRILGPQAIPRQRFYRAELAQQQTAFRASETSIGKADELEQTSGTAQFD